jgi:hypothetical protein
LFDSMAVVDGYDFMGMRPFMEENYWLLWQFKDCVVGETLEVSRYKAYIHVLHKKLNFLTYLFLNILEKVSLIKQFHGQFVLLGIQIVDEDGIGLQ